jgi:protein-ribulosamine 3-kinase
MMMWSESLKETCRELISEKAGDAVKLNLISPVGGGCINESFKVETSHGVFFVKYNDAGRYPGMFAAEARGLELLGATVSSGRRSDAANRSNIIVPAVVAQGGDNRYSLLVLDFLHTGSMSKTFWDDFGKGLAYLHMHSSKEFGLDHSNYIGSLLQVNRFHPNWIDFFISERIENQLKLARDSGRSGRELGKYFENVYPYLCEFFPDEPPALLHGDLWSGNYMVSKEGGPVILDPAVYYGHRYMDLGMTRLFGGFAPSFYHSYDAIYPLEKNWQQGIEIANLYPLLVHLNLFGGSYLTSLMNILKRFW